MWDSSASSCSVSPILGHSCCYFHQREGRVKQHFTQLYQNTKDSHKIPFFLKRDSGWRGEQFEKLHSMHTPAHVNGHEGISAFSRPCAHRTRGAGQTCTHRQLPCTWVPGFAPLITPPTGEKNKPKWSDCTKGGSL